MRRKPKLRLVYSGPPPERMLAASLDAGRHLQSFDGRRRDARYLDRFHKRTKVLVDRMRRAAMYDSDDALGAIVFVYYEVLDPMCNRDGDPTLLLGREILRKALDWMLAQHSPGSGGPPKLVG